MWLAASQSDQKRYDKARNDQQRNNKRGPSDIEKAACHQNLNFV
jgi:hypothetical protein